MKIVFARALLITSAALANAASQHVLRASFPDGTGVEIFTETTGSTPIATTGEMGIGPGFGTQDLVNRVVIDRDRNILFVYNLEASRGARPDTVKIRIQPISAATEEWMVRNAVASGRLRSSTTHLPTVAAVREFAEVKIGEVVTLDILYNPSSGEKIYDVLRPVASSSPRISVDSVPAPETISLKQIAMRVNGRAMPAPASWMIGVAVRIDIPRLGTYVLSTRDPRQDSPGREFAQIAHADGKTLSWAIGSDRVEIISGTNILTQSDKGALWVYHDPHYQPDVVGLQSADKVDWLLPKR